MTHPTGSMILTLKHAEDFRRALSRQSIAKTPHFSVHYLAEGVSPRRRGPREPTLSSAPSGQTDQPVDNSFENSVDKSLDKSVDSPSNMAWAGFVVPKRHARRAVTRNLIRRQMRQALQEHQGTPPGLPAGLWVLRLRGPFDLAQFPSASSEPLKRAARAELQQAMAQAARRAWAQPLQPS